MPRIAKLEERFDDRDLLPPAGDKMIVTLTVADLKALVRETVLEALSDHADPKPELCSVVEAAAELRTSPRNIHRWLATGRLRGASRVVPGLGSSRVLIPRKEIEALISRARR